MVKLRKDGTPDKRYKSSKVETSVTETVAEPVFSKTITQRQDPQELLETLLKENDLKLDFDVVSPGTVATKQGYIKITEPTLVVKASYVEHE